MHARQKYPLFAPNWANNAQFGAYFSDLRQYFPEMGQIIFNLSTSHHEFLARNQRFRAYF